MVPKRLPRDLGRHAMILMTVVQAVCQNEVWADFVLPGFEVRFYVSEVTGQQTIWETVYPRLTASAFRDEGVETGERFWRRVCVELRTSQWIRHFG